MLGGFALRSEFGCCLLPRNGFDQNRIFAKVAEKGRETAQELVGNGNKFLIDVVYFAFAILSVD